MLLEEIHSPSDIKKLSLQELTVLAAEMREEIIKTVARHGGHLASNLGAVELTLALHYVFDCPEDKLVFDVGHQCYAHKMLTGRFAALRDTLREEGGVSGFPRVSESECDAFTAGHASTAISAALGMARTRDVMGDDYHVVAVVGDGALTGGMCYEALNDAGQSGTRMIVILNENEMSISRNVGALSGYLTGLRQSRTYRAFKRGVRQGLERIPGVGAPMFRFVERFRDWLKTPFVDGKFFDALGFRYIGPVDGHDLKRLIRFFQRAKEEKDPQILHIVTTRARAMCPPSPIRTPTTASRLFWWKRGNSAAISTPPAAASPPPSLRRWRKTTSASAPSLPPCPPAPAWRCSARPIPGAFMTSALPRSMP